MPSMDLEEMIYRRKSVRSYTGEPVNCDMLHRIRAFADTMQPLYPHIHVQMEIVDKSQVKCILPWTTPQLIAIYSDPKDGYLENAGFLFQQMDLYLQSIGLGVCWLGMGKIKLPDRTDGKEFVMLMGFGHPKGNALRENVSQFRRRALSAISDKVDEQLEPARLAPSSVNSQPWYFVHQDGMIHTYCTHHGVLKSKGTRPINRIDVGIALAHLYVANADTFRFFRVNFPRELTDYTYIGSFTL